MMVNENTVSFLAALLMDVTLFHFQISDVLHSFPLKIHLFLLHSSLPKV